MGGGTRRMSPTSFLPILVLLVLVLASCSRKRTIEYEMTWSTLSEPDHIILSFSEFPNHYVDLTSAELRDYLDSLPGSDVTVEFEVTTRLGCLERIKAVRIGEHTETTHEWGGSGWVDHEEPSPWEEFRCLIPWW